MNKKILILVLFLLACRNQFNQDINGPAISLIHPEEGYVASDFVKIQFEVIDDSDVFIMNLLVNGIMDSSDYEFETPNIYHFMLDVSEYESGSIKIRGIGEDEFGNPGTTDEVEIFIDNSLRFVSISAGIYLDSENIQSEIPYDYQMMTYPVTLGQYLVFLNEAYESNEINIFDNKISGIINGTMRDFVRWGDSSSDYNIGAIDFIEDQFIAIDSSYIDHPITGVTWYGSKAFADNYKMRLPTVAEWEKVARGIFGYLYPWGNYNNSQLSNFDESQDPWEPGTTPVGYFNGDHQNTQDSKSPFGAYDMAGNVWEWTQNYVSGQGYILKGGSYQNLSFSQTTTNETTSFPSYFRDHFGFRCVRDL